MTVKPPVWWPKALLVVAALFLWWRHDVGQRSEGALRQQIHDVEAQRDARATVIAALVSRARPVDTVPLVTWLARWDTLYDTLDLRDTAKTHRQLVTADSTIKSCQAFKRDCVTQLANRDSTIRALAADTVDFARLLQLERKRRPSRFGCVAGGVASSHGVQPGIGCGFRITR